ncbi:Uncharacterised protein [Klebsiella pneumoniae]|nr:Uncharacterised protein [Klebsiella pneumoniae]
MRAHTDQLRDMHETVFENRFGDHAGSFCNQIQQSELSLHIGRETRVRGSTNVDGLRTIAVHIEANPVLARFNVRAGVA